MAERQRHNPTVSVILWLIGGGFLIGLSSCFGFLANFESGSEAASFFALGFFGGVVAVLLGTLIAIILFIGALVRSLSQPR